MEKGPGRSDANSNESQTARSRETTPGPSFYNSEESNWTLYKRFNMSMRINSPAPSTSSRQQERNETNRRLQPQPHQRHAEIPPHEYRESNTPGLEFSDEGEALIDGLNAVRQITHPMRSSYSRRAVRDHWTLRTKYPILPIGKYYRNRQWYPSIDKIRIIDKYINEMVSHPVPSKYTPPGPPGFNAAECSFPEITEPGPSQLTAAGPPQFSTSGPSHWTATPSTSRQQWPGFEQRKSKTARWTDRYTERRAARWTERYTERRAARWTERYSERRAARWTERYTERRAARWTERNTECRPARWTERYTERRAARWTERNTECRPARWTERYTERRTVRWEERNTERRAARWAERNTERRATRWTERNTERRASRWAESNAECRTARWADRNADRRPARWEECIAEFRAASEAEQQADLATLYPHCPWRPVTPPPPVWSNDKKAIESYGEQGLREHGETQVIEGTESHPEVQMMAQLDLNDKGDQRFMCCDDQT